VGATEDVRVEIRELVSEHVQKPVGKTLPRSFGGWLDRIEGARLSIRTDSGSCPLGLGALVEIETADELFLGEIKHHSGGTIFVDFEHELQKMSLDELRGVWRKGHRISGGPA
jgi:hypothetical protein